jgi:hypothetical protein
VEGGWCTALTILSLKCKGSEGSLQYRPHASFPQA